jgi:uncharacterized protein with ParB-like and HNH nuclease domain
MAEPLANVPAEPGGSESENITLQLDRERRNVSFDNYDIAVRQLLEMLGSKDINVAPEYQRKFVWEEERQSEFVESVFLGIPIPNLFMATNKDSTWEVVDGVQRLSTLVNFAGSDELRKKILNADAPLGLRGLEKLTALNDKKLSDLPKSVQLGFNNRPLRVTVLNDKSDLNVRFDLFERLNSGGVELKPQEIRNCVYRGPFNDKLKTLAQDANFRKVVKVSSADETNGTYEELVLRFFAFLERYKKFEHSVLDFLNSYMDEANHQPLSAESEGFFVLTFEFLAAELPEGIVRGKKITPFNLFEAVAVGTALVLQGGNQPKPGIVDGLLNNEDLKQLTSGGTNRNKIVVGRIEFVRDRLS